jgi:hypothetical protein
MSDHDGRFNTLLEAVDHHDSLLGLGLSGAEKRDLIEYLKSLPEAGSEHRANKR